TLFHRAGAIDARHMRQRADNARMPLRCQCVLVVERRVPDTDEHLARGQFIGCEALDTSRHLAVGTFTRNEGGERCGLVHLWKPSGQRYDVLRSIGSSSIFAARIKSFSESPPMACVHNSTETFR